MLLTPSQNWQIAATAAYRKITWATEIRIVSNLSAPLFSGAWTRIDHMIKDISDRGQRIEFDPGQFTADSLQVTVYDIKWWQDNIFTVVAPGQYIELRRRPSIGIGDGAMSADQVCVFSGFVDNTEGQLDYNYQENTIAFSVYTADDAGSRMSALRVNTQYINTSIDGAGTSGLILPRISGVFVKDANIFGYVLKAGMHELTYKYNGGTEQMKLDDGDFVALPTSDGTALLANGDNTQKIQVYVDVSALSNAGEIVDYVIVQNEGDILPRQPYYGLSIQTYVRKLYEQIGITDIAYDTLQFETWDGRKVISFYDTPPEDVAVLGPRTCVVSDGTSLWVSAGNKIYKKNVQTGVYTLKHTLPSGKYVVKLIFNSRTSDLWILYGALTVFNDAPNIITNIKYFNIISETSSAIYTLAGGDTNSKMAELLDYQYSVGNYKYGIVLVDASFCEFISAATMTNQTLYTNAENTLLYKFTSKKFHFFTNEVPDVYIREFEVQDSTGNFIDNGNIGNPLNEYELGMPSVYNLNENKIYFETVVYGLRYWTPGAASSSTITNTRIGLIEIFFIFGGNTYATYRTTTRDDGYEYFFKLQTTGETLANETAISMKRETSESAGVMYGIDTLGRLFRYSQVAQMYFKNASLEDSDVRSALNGSLTGYNLLGTISPHKKAGIYRRSDDGGNIQTSGNIIALDNTNIVSINEIKNNYPKVGLVEVSNGKITHTYNGTNFDSQVLSDIKRFPVSNSLLPDDLIKDLAYYFYQFWNKSLKVYNVQTNIASMEYEVFDAADIDYQSENQTINITGAIIIGAGNDNFGNMVFEVLK